MKSLHIWQNSQGKIWLNVASSIYVVDDFVNLDNHALLALLPVYSFVKRIIPTRYRSIIEAYQAATCKARLIRHNCCKRLPLPDNSVDHILCSHFLEHVYPTQAECILKDFRRVLKPGATLHVIVPNLKEQALRYLRNAEEGRVEAADEFIAETVLSRQTEGSLRYRLLEFIGGFGLQHRWMYDDLSMTGKLSHAGLTILDCNDTPSRSYRLGDGSVHIVASKQA